MTTIDTRTKRSGRHPINIGHFVMGIAFLGIVLVWILVESDAVTGDDIRWLLPVPWVLAGVAGLLATTRRKQSDWDSYESGRRGWVGHADAPAPVEETRHTHSPYDDLDERLARAERETSTRSTTATMATVAPPEPPEPPEPADPGDPEDPADPADPADPKENDR